MDTNDIVDTNTNEKFKFGQYFFKLFNKPITQYFSKLPDKFVQKIFSKNSLNSETLGIILIVLKELKNQKM